MGATGRLRIIFRKKQPAFMPRVGVGKWQLRVIGKIPDARGAWRLWSKWSFCGVVSAEGNAGGEDHPLRSVADFAAFDAEEATLITHRCEESCAPIRIVRPILDIIERSRQHGARLFCRDALPKRHNDLFASTRFCGNIVITSHFAPPNIYYVQASEWVLDEDAYADVRHLNPQGANLQRRLAKFMSSQRPETVSKRLTKELRFYLSSRRFYALSRKL